MAKISNHLTSLSPGLRSGPSRGRQLVALMLCAMLSVGIVLPGLAAAGEVDSEGEGTVLPVEAPAPDFDPGGEETALEEASAAAINEESGAVEGEPEVDPEVPTTAAVTEEAPEESQPEPVEVLPIPAASEPEPVQEEAAEPAPSEPVANQSLVAPKRDSAERPARHEQAVPAETAVPPAEPAEEEAPTAPAEVAVPQSAHSGRNLQGQATYVVKPGDCLWHIAEALLPAGAGTVEIEDEIEHLWRLNADRIGTGDPSIIYPGTVLRLR